MVEALFEIVSPAYLLQGLLDFSDDFVFFLFPPNGAFTGGNGTQRNCHPSVRHGYVPVVTFHEREIEVEYGAIGLATDGGHDTSSSVGLN